MDPNSSYCLDIGCKSFILPELWWPHCYIKGSVIIKFNHLWGKPRSALLLQEEKALIITITSDFIVWKVSKHYLTNHFGELWDWLLILIIKYLSVLVLFHSIKNRINVTMNTMHGYIIWKTLKGQIIPFENTTKYAKMKYLAAIVFVSLFAMLYGPSTEEQLRKIKKSLFRNENFKICQNCSVIERLTYIEHTLELIQDGSCQNLANWYNNWGLALAGMVNNFAVSLSFCWQ